MEGRYQRCTLSTDLDISTAEVSDNINPGARGNNIRIANLQGVRLRCIGFMTNGLPVAANGNNVFRQDAGF